MAREGCLYIVATPIGNLGDITFRAIEVLKTVDVIAAEDTRHSQRLLGHYGIKTASISLHEFNERQRIAELVKRLQDGQQIALISDAGTPLVSDPGYLLVKSVRDLHFRVVPVPGACAAIAALCASGLPTDRFIFEGFLPPKGARRKQRLIELHDETRSMIFYEAVHRINDLIELMINVFGGERRVVIARELTKAFETIHQSSLADIKQWLEDEPEQRRGEFVVVLQGIDLSLCKPDVKALKRLLEILLSELSLKQAVDLAAKISKGARNELYQLALQLKKGKT